MQLGAQVNKSIEAQKKKSFDWDEFWGFLQKKIIWLNGSLKVKIYKINRF